MKVLRNLRWPGLILYWKSASRIFTSTKIKLVFWAVCTTWLDPFSSAGGPPSHISSIYSKKGTTEAVIIGFDTVNHWRILTTCVTRRSKITWLRAHLRCHIQIQYTMYSYGYFKSRYNRRIVPISLIYVLQSEICSFQTSFDEKQNISINIIITEKNQFYSLIDHVRYLLIKIRLN